MLISFPILHPFFLQHTWVTSFLFTILTCCSISLLFVMYFLLLLSPGEAMSHKRIWWFDLCVRANKESFSLGLKFKSSEPIKTNWQHSQSSMGSNVLNRKLIYLGFDQKSWSSSMLFNIVGIIWKAKMPQLPKKKKKKQQIFTDYLQS